MGLFYGSLGLASAVGSLKLRRCHQRINPLYPEMQISLPRGSLRGVRASDSVSQCTIGTSTKFYDVSARDGTDGPIALIR